MTTSAYVVLRLVLLGATAAMFALHLVTGRLLRAGVRALKLLRFEAAYYVFLLAAVAAGMRELLFPGVLLGAIHLAAWIYGEKKMVGNALSRRVMAAVQWFDWSEAVVLAWIGLAVWRR